jgi:alpha-galactosidase
MYLFAMKTAAVASVMAGLLTAGAWAGPVRLDELGTANIDAGWGTPHANRSIDGNALKIGGQTFEHGIGTHANCEILVNLNGGTDKFTASVGVDEEVGAGKGSVNFRVVADGKELWNSGTMKAGDAAKQVAVETKGAKQLSLIAGDADEEIDFDHADWANAVLEVSGAKPTLSAPPKEEAVILTPKPPKTPRINGARVYGVRPGHPFLFVIPATGDRPMTFAADGLPEGLKVDPATGIITGVTEARGSHSVTLKAKNALGEAKRDFRIEVGDRIALTPPMGWNSWNCFASAVDAERVKSAAAAMIKSGLVNHGWSYVNIDDFWEIHKDSKDPSLQGPGRDAQGRMIPNPRFPNMKGLCDSIHGLGLKVGIYSSPGPYTCGGCLGSFDHEQQDAQSYAEWGIDYLKYDWCSYGPALEARRGKEADFSGMKKFWGGPKPKEREALARPYALMRAMLDKAPRDIVYSLCQYGMGDVWEWGADVGGNCWRTTGDITDSWGSLSGIGFKQAGHEPFAGPGHWNDPDMLIVGMVGWGPSLHPTHLTPNEQYTHISLWCLLCSPLLIGCDMTQLDDFTLSLLTNDEVLEVSQDPLGKQAARLQVDGQKEVWAKAMDDGSLAVGLFNRGSSPMTVTADFSKLGLTGTQRVRDLWRQQDVGDATGQYETTVPRHGCVLVRFWAKP